MGLEDEAVVLAARAGWKTTWVVLRIVAFAAFLIGILALGYCGKQRADQIQSELDAGRRFRDEIQRRDALNTAASAAKSAAQQPVIQLEQKEPQVILIHDKATQEAAREDHTVAADLQRPIPQRLRDADAQARQSSR